MRTVGYARVSSKAQSERQTIEGQLRVIDAFVTRQGWQLVRPLRTYVDDGRTAKAGHLGKRDGFAELVRDAGAGVFDVVVVFDLDRLTRSEDITERGEIIGSLQRAGVQVAIATTGQVLDLRSSMGDLFQSLQTFFAADWLRKHRERIMAGKLRAIAEGRKPAGPTPFGYSYDRSAGWSVRAEHAELVLEMFRRVVAGEACSSIGDDLAERGMRRPRGGDWSMERVWQIVTSRTYLGTWVADKHRGLTVAVPQIVPDELWYAAQASLARHRKRGLRRTKHIYLLEALAVCEFCGGPIHVSSHGARVPSTYVCRRRRRPQRGQLPCTLPHRRSSDVDESVWTALRSVLEREDLLERAVAQRSADTGADRQAWARDLEDARARLGRLQEVEAALMARFRRGLISEGAMDTELAAAARERAMLGRQVDAARQGARAAHADAARLRSARADVDAMRRRLRSQSAAVRRGLVVALLGQTPVIMSAKEVRAMVRLRLAPALAVGSLGSAGFSSSGETNGGDYFELELVAR
jgi:site-specific DNA recombinase